MSDSSCRGCLLRGARGTEGMVEASRRARTTQLAAGLPLLLSLPAAADFADCLVQLLPLCGPERAAGERDCLVCCGRHQRALRGAGCNQSNVGQFCTQREPPSPLPPSTATNTGATRSSRPEYDTP